MRVRVLRDGLWLGNRKLSKGEELDADEFDPAARRSLIQNKRLEEVERVEKARETATPARPGKGE